MQKLPSLFESMGGAMQALMADSPYSKPNFPAANGA
jgi:hypothetical protein